MFIDQIELTLKAGKGGDGIVAWRREKYLPKGGPYGGDGGKGGSVYVEVDTRLLSLDHYRQKHILKAENGQQGGRNNQKGKNGKDLILKVPLGTIIKDKKTNHVLFELLNKDDNFLICKGGRGGKGNFHFRSPTNRAPNTCTLGKEGESLRLDMELKLIADIGLIGMPNAGKSTLMKNLTKSKVKIAAYPFTTLHPNIGVLEFDDFKKILVADIPGIIANAHKNKGLGISFLKHIERTSILVYVIDISGLERENPLEDFQTLQNELKKYNEKMLKKPFFIILNKIDLPSCQKHIKAFKQKVKNQKIFEISALNKEGISSFIGALQELF